MRGGVNGSGIEEKGMRFAAARLASGKKVFAALLGLAILRWVASEVGAASGSGRPLKLAPIGEGIFLGAARDFTDRSLDRAFLCRCGSCGNPVKLYAHTGRLD